MVEYDIKRGWYKNIDGDLLKGLMAETFGNVIEEGNVLVSSYGVLSRIEARIVSKDKLEIVTSNREGAMSDSDILDSKRRLNVFAEKATGFDAKARMKRAQQKAKKGEL